MKAIVVSKYNENLDWLTDYHGYKIYVYNKSSIDVPGHIMLPNQGREQSSFDFHCWQNWDKLDDITIFCQGSLEGHVTALPETTGWFTGIGIQRPHDGEPGSISRDMGLWPGAVSVDGCKQICKIIEKPYTDLVEYNAGGMYIATKACLQQYPAIVYQQLYELALVDPQYAWDMERMRSKMFAK